jgi:hypothetical protein
MPSHYAAAINPHARKTWDNGISLDTNKTEGDFTFELKP